MRGGRACATLAAMQPIRRILVAIKNPAARALPAVNKAAQIAKGLKAQLTLFHDIATPVYAEALQGRDVDIRSWQRVSENSDLCFFYATASQNGTRCHRAGDGRHDDGVRDDGAELNS